MFLSTKLIKKFILYFIFYYNIDIILYSNIYFIT